jgi:hypothetical protein
MGQYLADAAETRSAQDIIDAYRQLIPCAHARGIKVIGATMTPCEDVDIPPVLLRSKRIGSGNGKQMDQNRRRIRRQSTSTQSFVIQIILPDCCRSSLQKTISILMMWDTKRWQIRSISLSSGDWIDIGASAKSAGLARLTGGS